jgi:hypothetical protein
MNMYAWTKGARSLVTVQTSEISLLNMGTPSIQQALTHPIGMDLVERGHRTLGNSIRALLTGTSYQS